MESTEETLGRKFDNGKPQYSLLPPLALIEAVKVLTFGAKKYSPDNWKYVDNKKQRYFELTWFKLRMLDCIDQDLIVDIHLTLVNMECSFLLKVV